MFRRVTIAASALVVLTALAWRLSILAESTALAQQPGQQQVGQQQPVASQAAQKQAAAQPTSQPTTQATQPAQGKLVVQTVPATQPGQARLGAAPPGTHGLPGTPPVLLRDQIEKLITPEEREALGLPEPTWVKQHGKAHPDVREILKTGQMPWVRFKGWEPDSCAGTAYVAVYLRHEQRGEQTSKENQAGIKALQSQVLTRLTAAEFRTVYAFKSTPGFLGYVNAEGVAKLEKDADVLAVVLDGKPVPEDPARQVREQEYEHPVERIGKIEARVYTGLETSVDGYVFVIVNLTRVDWQQVGVKRGDAMVKEMEDRVLSSVTAEEFRVRSRRGGPVGYVNAAGLAKLDGHPDVWSVGLEGPPPTYR